MDKTGLTGVSVPTEHRAIITKLLLKKSDIFAVNDADLGHTETVKIDTGDHTPIKLRP